MLVAIALLGAPLRGEAAIPASERQVLTSLYDATGGGGWSSNANWCSGACPASGAHSFNGAGTECGWYGVTCDAGQAHVIALALPANHLVGTLPGLSALASLQYFNVSSNSLNGPLPPLAALSQLETFLAGDNALSGAIPSLAGMTHLGDFAVPNNQLTGTIPALTGLTGLYSFIVAGNRMSGSVPSPAGLGSLRDLDVGSNSLSGTLPSLSGSTLLRFSAAWNGLTGAVPALPASLQTVQLGGNRLSGAVPAAPATLYTPVAYAPSSLCPNPLSLSATANDAGWNAATGFSPWWAAPFAGNRCDDLLHGAFDGT